MNNKRNNMFTELKLAPSNSKLRYEDYWVRLCIIHLF